MKRLMIAVAVVFLLASCQSPIMQYDADQRKLVPYEPETVTITIVIE